MASWGRLLCCVCLLGRGGSSAADTCREACDLPDQCFQQFGIPSFGDDCQSTCGSVIDDIGVGCVDAILSGIDCLGTCDFSSATDAELAACADEGRAVASACD
ncbi:MAG: hypothetical protein AAGF92_20305 [Myxococcota bacterium]